MIKTTGSFLLAVIAAYLLGAIFIIGNIAAVVALGFDVGIGQRLDAAVHDTLNMTDIYLPLVAISLLLISIAYAIVRKRPHLRLIGFTMVGFYGIGCDSRHHQSGRWDFRCSAHAHAAGIIMPGHCGRCGRLSLLSAHHQLTEQLER